MYLVGAGPGDPELVTLKGRRVLEEADVVVVDRLASPGVLCFIREDAEIIWAGKEPGGGGFTQKEINQLLVERALKGKTVVRLKGGDPFVFGRGGEEAQSLAAAGIPYEIVPGVSSALAAPAYAGIPLTHRGLSSSVSVVTGSEDPAKEAGTVPWNYVAGLDTAVILMGVKELANIVRHLRAGGRNGRTPVAAVMWGTTAEQKTLVAPLDEIEEAVTKEGISSPAVLILGEVVSLRERLKWREKLPLFGCRIVITRPRHQGVKLAESIAGLGGEPWHFPAINIEPLPHYGELDRVLERLGEYDFLVFTSFNGVDFFFRRLKVLGIDIRAVRGRIAAIGPATAKELEARGLVVEFLPAEYRSEGLVDTLAPHVRGKRVLLVRASAARRLLADELARCGAEVDDVPVYRVTPAAKTLSLLKHLLSRHRVDAVVFFSPSEVNAFFQHIESRELDTRVIAIGPVTAAQLAAQGIDSVIVAREYTGEGVLATLKECLARAKES